MADVKLTIWGIDKASATFRKLQSVGTGAFNKIKSAGAALKNTLFSLKGAIAAIGVGLVAKSFVDAASTAENYRVRLNALLGDVDEGNRLFKDMADFASGVSFEYEQIMGSATSLSGVMTGGVDEIKKWMPLIADLAAVSGLSIEETTSQVIRMYSAGAAAADMFRERGILAMLGFQAGVSYTAEETRDKMFEAWEATDSKFKDASKELSTTWDGLMSMMADKWFTFRTKVMESGPFQSLKNAAGNLLEYLNTHSDQVNDFAEKTGKAIIEYARKFVTGIGVIAEATITNGAKAIDWFREQMDNLNGLKLALSKIEEYTLKGIMFFTPEDTDIARKMRNRLVEIKEAQADLYMGHAAYEESGKAIDSVTATTDKLKSALDAVSKIIVDPKADLDDKKAKDKISFIRIELERLDKMTARPQVIVETFTKSSPVRPFSEGMDYMEDRISGLSGSAEYTMDLSSLTGLIGQYTTMVGELNQIVNPLGPGHPHYGMVNQQIIQQREPYERMMRLMEAIIGKYVSDTGGKSGAGNFQQVNNINFSGGANISEIDSLLARQARYGRSEFATALR